MCRRAHWICQWDLRRLASDATFHCYFDVDDVFEWAGCVVDTKQIHIQSATEFLIFWKEHVGGSAVTGVVVIGIHWMLTRTLLGMRLRAVGHNVQTARVSGVNVRGVVIFAYVLCGVSAAMASVLITSQLETGSPVQWQHNLLDIVGATVIGGTSLYGGRGSVYWTASGVLLLALIDNSLNLLNLSHFTIMMSKGVVILLAALLDTLRHRVVGGSET